MIVGRQAERSRLNRLVADAKDGRSRALVLHGEAGIGKTALLDYAAGIAGGMRVIRAAGIESEAEIPFAALQLMFAGDADRVDALPAPQAKALGSAFGWSTEPGDRIMVGAATLTLLAELAGDQPLLCLLDDVQWFDRSSIDALLFALRRLRSDPIATVLAVRDGDRPFSAPGIEPVTLSRLDRGDSARLLTAVRPLPDDVADRVLAESGGNPLAIVEFASTTSGRRPLPPAVAPLSAAGRLDEHYRQQIRQLPERTRIALLLAAADHGSEPRSLLAAGRRMDVVATDLEPAEQAGLVRVGPDAVAFRHPLIRAAAYQEASFAKRLEAHRALAEVLGEPRDADRRAWHLAAAAGGTDESAAVELERAAQRATTRGAPSAAAHALERAAQLGADHSANGRRLVAAARAAYDAGRLDHAVELATSGIALTSEPGDVAEAGWIQAQVAYERHSPAEAAARALDAAEPVLALDPRRAVSVLTEATWCARDAADEHLLRRCAELLGAVRGGPSTVIDAVTGFTVLLRGDVEHAVAPLRALLRAGAGDADETLDRLTAGFAGLLIGEDSLALTVLDEHVAVLRAQGALGWLSYALEPLALAQLLTGRFRDAEAHAEEARAAAADLGQGMEVVVLTAISAWLAAVRGDAARATVLAASVLADTRRHAMAAGQATWALALVDLMDGDPEGALEQLGAVCSGPVGWDLSIRAVADLVEAAVRAGDPARGRQQLSRLAEWARHTGSPTGAALVLRCDALLGAEDEAEKAFEAALGIDGCSPYDRARTQLVYGEWLRRHRRRTVARTVLEAAQATFGQIGAMGWQRRVRTELGALGGSAPDRDVDVTGIGVLTPQELQVVRRAALGLTNREIAVQLFLSPRTVSHHLYKAYPKLGVSKRNELADLDF
ncbi:ATP-binding protein [Pseudonocardia sp. TRM90224]|uniref:ATP-binding protein n=1 Tax=Pseudonocardia sp. TRM90224 TaxID=2812678 RepID=UPI001E5C7C1D|nr:LuxR family transcriptional regulator [Pseudonocardia sp. TRM90224]